MDRSSAITNPRPVPYERRASDGILPEQKLEIFGYWRAILKHKWKIAILIVAFVTPAVILGFVLPPVYRSTATVLVESVKQRGVSIEGAAPGADTNFDPGHFQTQVELIKSREVAERTIRRLQLLSSAEWNPVKREPTWAVQIKQLIGIDSSVAPKSENDLVSAAVRPFADALTVETVGLSHLIRISFDSQDRAMSARIANTLAEEYITADREARLAVANQISGYLQERLSSLHEKLAQSERALQNYRESRGIVSLGGSSQTLAGQQAGGTNDRLILARARRAELQSSYEQTNAVRNGDYGSIPAVIRYPGVIDASRQLNDAKRRLAELSETLGSQNTRIQQIQSEIVQLNSTLVQERAAAVASLRSEYEAARDTEQSLERALGSARKDVQVVNRDEFQLVALEQDASTNRQIYELFLNRSKETSLSSDVQAPVARIADHAREATNPVKPAKLQLVAFALILALLSGSLLAILIEHVDTSIKSAEDAELRLGRPVLASIPLVPPIDQLLLSRLSIDSPFSAHAEAIRTARSGLMLFERNISHKIVLVTSALPDEGKTTFACNLALSLAQTQRVLLIDADMRRSKAAERLGLPSGLAGLTDLISGKASVRDTVQIVRDSQLLVMPVGSTLPINPLDLLLSERLRAGLKALAEQFDMVIIDSPPVEPVSDATTLAPLSTITLVVVKASSTPAQVVRRTLSKLQRGGATSLMTVINALDPKEARRRGQHDMTGYGYAEPP